MIYVQLSNVSFGYHDRIIIRNFTQQLKTGCRIGFIGANGSGKTTLLLLLLGQLIPDEGEISKAKDLKIGFLPQIPEIVQDCPLKEEMRKPFTRLLEMEAKIEQLSCKISRRGSDHLAEQYDGLLDRFHREGGYQFRAKTTEVLNGLGFGKIEWEKPLRSFSGGERARIMLAKLLLEEPDLILLDEPTNHLDIDAIEWLERFLDKFDGGAVIISHDRYFLDKVPLQIMELANRQVDIFNGNYSTYLEKKKKKVVLMSKRFKHQQEYIHKQEDYIRRNIAGQKTKQAKSRLKALNKLERLENPKGSVRRMRLHIESEKSSGRVVLETEGIKKVFNDNLLFDDVTLRLHRGEIIGFIGPNGSGKSTFLQILTGKLQPETGNLIWGHQVKLGYFDQHLYHLKEAKNILDEVWDIRPELTDHEIRNHLGRFLFSDEDVLKPIVQLSGGEKARVALAKLFLERSNVLLLDEPTNHLDLTARESLEDALLSFSGTVIMVTHDRFLLNRIAHRIWALENRSIEEYLGNYSDYREWKDRESEKDDEIETRTKRSSKPSKKDLRKARVEIRRKTGKSSQYYEREAEDLEGELERIRSEMKDPDLATDWTALDALVGQEKTLRAKLDKTMKLWEIALEAEQNMNG